ncbi:MAG: ATP-grasp domain-containing protein [Spirochaetales bacterium]|nr:ATP-grasp domain-containing protein [Spirochaetales bacterium]
MILGAGVMQMPAIRLAREQGWRVAVADGDAAAAGAGIADEFLHVDLKDRDALEAAARGLRAAGGLDGVFTAGTDFSANVAWIAERLGLPGIPHATALDASDKGRMRERFAAAGVPSPRFVTVGAGEDATLAAERIGFPLVVKPVDNMGARGCRLVAAPGEYGPAIADALRSSRAGRAIVEEYIEGPEFSIDAIVSDGRVELCGVADRHIAFAPFFVELGHTMPSAFPPEAVGEVVRVFKLGVRALGLGPGAAKGDIKLGKRGAVVGEIAARLSGGYMSGWTYPYASGAEPTLAALRVAVGLPPGDLAPRRAWVSAERAFISIPGTVARLDGEREAKLEPFVKDVFLRLGPGARAVFPSNNVEKGGNVISQAPDRTTAIEAAERAARSLLPILEPRNAATEGFLEGAGSINLPDGRTWPPHAYGSAPAEFLETVAALPAEADGAEPERGAALPYLPLPLSADALASPDWLGRPLSESIEIVERLSGTRPARPGEAALAGRFWQALERGGWQAALYVVDTERAIRAG